MREVRGTRREEARRIENGLGEQPTREKLVSQSANINRMPSVDAGRKGGRERGRETSQISLLPLNFSASQE